MMMGRSIRSSTFASASACTAAMTPSAKPPLAATAITAAIAPARAFRIRMVLYMPWSPPYWAGIATLYIIYSRDKPRNIPVF